MPKSTGAEALQSGMRYGENTINAEIIMHAEKKSTAYSLCL